MLNLIQHGGVLIVAAGESKRLGRPKQLLKFEGQTFINRLIDIVRASCEMPITLVLGAEAEAIQAQLIDTKLNVVLNEDWKEGMGTSIRIGLTKMIQTEPALDGVMILVCDQPFVKSEHIQSLIQLQKDSRLPMAACFYVGIVGTPALFHQSMFPALLDLNGEKGAKKILNEAFGLVAKLNFEEGVMDIDTEEDYQKIIQGEK